MRRIYSSPIIAAIDLHLGFCTPCQKFSRPFNGSLACDADQPRILQAKETGTTDYAVTSTEDIPVTLFAIRHQETPRLSDVFLRSSLPWSIYYWHRERDRLRKLTPPMARFSISDGGTSEQLQIGAG